MGAAVGDPGHCRAGAAPGAAVVPRLWFLDGVRSSGSSSLGVWCYHRSALCVLVPPFLLSTLEPRLFHSY